MKFKKSFAVRTKTIASFVFLFFSFTFTYGECPPYYIPDIPTEADYATKVYIDPSSSVNGNGTIGSPYNSFEGITVAPNTAYLFKRGTIYNETVGSVWNNNLVGAYGVGEMPVIFGFGVSASGSTTSENLVVRDLEFRKVGPEGVVFGFAHDPRPNNVTVAYCKIKGIDEGNGYPEHTLNHGAHNLVFFNNEVSGCRRNGWWINGDNIKIIRNWFYKINTSGETSLNPGDGDVIQSIYGFQDGYIAGNILDKSNAMWKYVLMFNLEGHPPVPSTNITVEYNTFHSNKSGEGGAAVRWVVGPNCSFKKNVINSIGLSAPFDRSNSNQWAQEAPYGIRDNHILIEDGRDVGAYGVPSRTALIEQSNLIFNSHATYNSYTSTNDEIGLYGSDINPLTFLTENDDLCGDGEIIPDTYTLNISINGNGSITKNPDKEEYEQDEVVEITAVPATGWIFDGWSEGASGSSNPISIVMDSPKNITANFQLLQGEPEPYVVQSASGTNAAFSQPPTAGNLLVAILAHRQDPKNNPDIPAGFTLREDIQFMTNNSNRHGVLVCDKISDGTETSFNLNFGTTSDLGGIVIEFDIQDAIFFEANANTTGNEIISSFTENVPKPSAQYLSVAAAVSRYADGLTNWNNEFVSPLATQDQMGAATRLDTQNDKPGTVTVQNSGEQGAIIAATWTIGYEEGEDPEESFLINTSVSGSGSIALNPNKAEYAENETVQVTATPDAGWEFSNWSGDLSGNTNPTSIITDSDKNITASFSIQSFSITASASPVAGGTISGAGNYNFGQTVTLVASPAIGYHFVNWTESGTVVSADTNYSFSATASKNFTANFELNSHTISLSGNPPDGNTLTGDGVYDYGQTANINALPEQGYTFVDWTENGNVVSTQPNYSFTVTADRSLTANFSPDTYSITLSPNPAEGGSTNGAGEYNHGETANIVATSSEGYTFTNWTENNTIVSTQASFTIDVTADRNLTANFSTNAHTITLGAIPSNGGSVSGTGNYEHGETAAINAIPNTGYFFVNWTENGTIVSTQPNYSFTVTSSRILIANFSQNTYAVNLNVTPIEGGNVSGEGNYSHGQTVNITATPNEDYTFLNWTEDGNEVSNELNYTFTATSDRSLTANFSLEAYSVNLNANPLGAGILTGGGNYQSGQTVSINAIPNDGYTFAGWTENGIDISGSPSYSFTITENRNLTAHFNPTTHIVSLTANPAEGGSLSGGGQFNYGQTAVVSATPASGYSFISWTENGKVVSTSPDFSFVVTENWDLTANFSTNAHIVNLSANPANGGTLAGAGTYEHGYSLTIAAVPNNGFSFVNWTENGEVISNDAFMVFDVLADRNITANFSLENYSVELIAQPSYAGTVAGGGIYQPNQTITIEATPNENYSFNYWTHNNTIVSEEAIFTFEVDQSMVLMAHFFADSPPIFIDTEVWPAGYGFAYGGGEYQMDQTVNLVATPNDDSFRFMGWYAGDELISEEPVLSFLASECISIHAVFDHFIREFKVSASVENLQDLPVEVDQPIITGSGIYDEGDVAVLEINAPSDIKFVGWKNAAGQIVSRQNPYEFMVNRNIELKAMVQLIETDGSEISVYPNPSNGQFRININTDAHVEVYNSSGTLLERRFLTNGENRIDVSVLPIGIYLMRVLTGSKILSTKIIIK